MQGKDRRIKEGRVHGNLQHTGRIVGKMPDGGVGWRLVVKLCGFLLAWLPEKKRCVPWWCARLSETAGDYTHSPVKGVRSEWLGVAGRMVV